MKTISFSLLLFAALLAAGCTTPYSVKLDGDVQGSDSDTPRAVKADVHFGDKIQAMRSAGGRHLHPLTDATVTVQLKLKNADKAKSAQTIKVDSRLATFHYEASGEDGPLTGVWLSVKAPGHQPVERLLASAPEVPFEETILAILDETGPGAPDAAGPDAAKAAAQPAPSPSASPAGK